MMQKTAAQQSAENAYWDEMAKQAMAAENDATEALFNQEFELHTMKLAHADPEYAYILESEMAKQASADVFNQAVHDELARYGYTFQG